MQQQILTYINTENLFSANDKILVAVSGGKDSMALLHVLHKNNFRIAAAHCNFQLRGTDADADQQWVLNFCAENNIECFVKAFETQKVADAEGISTQMAARELRYTWFRELAETHDFQYIATAHHHDDAIETLILNLVNGTGPKGLKAIPQKTYNIVRPMLSVDSQQIVEYLMANNILWRDDKSNFENAYSRNKIRNLVVPIFKEINVGFGNTMSHNLKRFAALNAVFQDFFNDFVKKNVRKNGDSFIIDISKIKDKDQLFLVLEEFLKSHGFNFTQVDNLLNSKISGSKILSNTHQLFSDLQSWYLIPKIMEITGVTIFSTGTYDFNGKKISIEIINDFPSVDELKNPNLAFLNNEKISWPIEVRNWKDGDKFKPFGMKGSKLISDFLIDNKVNIYDKINQKVLLSNDKIIWLVGHRIHDDFKIDRAMKDLLRIEVQ